MSKSIRPRLAGGQKKPRVRKEEADLVSAGGHLGTGAAGRDVARQLEGIGQTVRERESEAASRKRQAYENHG